MQFLRSLASLGKKEKEGEERRTNRRIDAQRNNFTSKAAYRCLKYKIFQLKHFIYVFECTLLPFYPCFWPIVALWSSLCTLVLCFHCYSWHTHFTWPSLQTIVQQNLAPAWPGLESKQILPNESIYNITASNNQSSNKYPSPTTLIAACLAMHNGPW